LAGNWRVQSNLSYPASQDADTSGYRAQIMNFELYVLMKYGGGGVLLINLQLHAKLFLVHFLVRMASKA
jgi:hypothetical protein